MIWRLAGILIAIAALYAGAQLVWHGFTRNARVETAASSAAPPPWSSSGAATAGAPPMPPQDAPAEPAPPVVAAAQPLPPAPPPGPCNAAPAFAAAAKANADSVTAAAWNVFGRPETGWEIYAPLASQEIGAACGPGDTGFAQALANWQGGHGLPKTGIMDPATLKAMNIVWLRRRPFVSAFSHGACPDPPEAFRLAFATPAEGYLTKPIQMRTGALAAYRQLVAAAKADLPSMAQDKRLLTIFSGYRGPEEQAAKCAADGNCGTITRANCSAHRTGLAMDVFLGAAPGFAPESSADPNRLFQSRSDVYRWMVRNASRFGFVPYPFEPWHWEWTGEGI